MENEYKDLGWENGWKGIPKELMDCHGLKHRLDDIKNLYPKSGHTVKCAICRIVYNYDSGD